MKTYVLMLSKTFLKGHPREGEETYFHEKVKVGINCGVDAPILSKIHTIRANYELWEKRIDEVNAGGAVLSVRQWTGKPRRSKQEELFRFDKDSGIGVEKLWRYPKYFNSVSDLDGRDPDHLVEIEAARKIVRVDDYIVAENDDLTFEDWEAWFNDNVHLQPKAIIQFTKFRYCN